MGRQPGRHANLFLVGFMGAGKSTVGPILAALLGRPWVDLDEEIARAAGLSIPEIFARDGEEAFRRREREAVTAVCGQRGLVVGTGGGVLVDPENRKRLAAAGTLVWLRAPLEVLCRRALSAGGRPLLAGEEDPLGRAAELYRRREPLYAQADVVVDTVHRTPAEVARAVVEALRQEGCGG